MLRTLTLMMARELNDQLILHLWTRPITLQSRIRVVTATNLLLLDLHLKVAEKTGEIIMTPLPIALDLF